MAAASERNMVVNIAQSDQLIVSSKRQYVVRNSSIKISMRWGKRIMGTKKS
jgi:hypothetical protein